MRSLVRKKLIEFRGTATQSDMGKKYKVSQQTWSKWELGKSAPSLQKAKEIAQDAGIPMEELFFTSDN